MCQAESHVIDISKKMAASKKRSIYFHVGVSENSGVFPPNHPIMLIGFSNIFTIHFLGFSFIFGNTHVFPLRAAPPTVEKPVEFWTTFETTGRQTNKTNRIFSVAEKSCKAWEMTIYDHVEKSRWWQLKDFFLCSPLFGEDSHFD